MGTNPEDRIQPAYSKRPEPDEPYRYCCPRCGTHRVAKRTSEADVDTLYDSEIIQGDSVRFYWCEVCGVRFGLPIDEKDGKRQRP